MSGFFSSKCSKTCIPNTTSKKLSSNGIFATCPYKVLTLFFLPFPVLGSIPIQVEPAFSTIFFAYDNSPQPISSIFILLKSLRLDSDAAVTHLRRAVPKGTIQDLFLKSYLGHSLQGMYLIPFSSSIQYCLFHSFWILKCKVVNIYNLFFSSISTSFNFICFYFLYDFLLICYFFSS